MQAKDFFHLASLRYGKQLGHGLTPAFETRLVSPDGQPVNSFSDVMMPVDGGLENADIIIFRPSGTISTPCKRYPQVLPWLRQQHARGAVLCGEATGVFWLAEAGLLDGKEATTYWRFFNAFAERFPKVQLNQDKHLTDADNLYCAGGTTRRATSISI
jgi:transcriptional regulator GlxA family with amidase domain